MLNWGREKNTFVTRKLTGKFKESNVMARHYGWYRRAVLVLMRTLRKFAVAMDDTSREAAFWIFVISFETEVVIQE